MKKLTDAQIRSVCIRQGLAYGKYAVRLVRAIEDELDRINGLTAEAAERREQGQAVQFLANGTRFKVTLTANDCKLAGLPRDLGGRWVALVAADDDCHLKLTTPPTPSAGVPEGWKLVPVEPTLDMGWAYLDAANALFPDNEHSFNHAGYRAMLSAAPQPAAQTQEREAGE